MNNSLVCINFPIWIDKQDIEKIIITQVKEFEWRMNIYMNDCTAPLTLVHNKPERLQMLANDLGKIPTTVEFGG